MTKDYDLPSDDFQEDEIAEQDQDQTANEVENEGYNAPDGDDSPEVRLQSLSAEHARERAELAEQISQLQEENDRLKQCIQMLEQPNPLRQNDLTAPSESEHYTEHGLGLDFSVPEDRR